VILAEGIHTLVHADSGLDRGRVGGDLSRCDEIAQHVPDHVPRIAACQK
jgi:hypothetical protein